MRKLGWSLIAASMLLAGCAARIPESLSVADEQILVAFDAVKTAPAEHQDVHVRWGGTIAQVTNFNDYSMIEIVEFELKSNTRPNVTDNSRGRFRAYVKGFIDPMVYKPGRVVTVLGIVKGEELGQVGEYAYRFAAVTANSVFLWKERDEVEVYYVDPWLTSPFHRYDPWYWRYGPTIKKVVPKSTSTTNVKSIR